MKKSLIDIEIGHQMLSFNQVTEFYNSLEWLAYSKSDQKERLLEAIQNLDYVVRASEKKIYPKMCFKSCLRFVRSEGENLQD